MRVLWWPYKEVLPFSLFNMVDFSLSSPNNGKMSKCLFSHCGNVYILVSYHLKWCILGNDIENKMDLDIVSLTTVNLLILLKWKAWLLLCTSRSIPLSPKKFIINKNDHLKLSHASDFGLHQSVYSFRTLVCCDFYHICKWNCFQ